MASSSSDSVHATPVSVAIRAKPPAEEDEEEICCGPLQNALRVDDPDLCRAIAPFRGVPQTRWKKGDVLRAVPVLRNRLCFIAHGCGGEHVDLWTEFVDEWEIYLAEHPDIMKLVDPHYVSFSFPAAGAPAAFAANVAATDAAVGVVAVLMAGGIASPNLFRVGSARWASFFAGRMRALHPVVACVSFASAALTVYN